MRDEPNPTMEPPLSARECEVLELIAHGRKNREIALALEIEERTVRFHEETFSVNSM
ncbi:MAG: helix-turn-helix transcriptional regulator [Anaerolineales bacterium]|nr:helix-turn-helix transcriptional regulator [Anaerolineales bacterium]NUQ83561.1 helix-turn-helix transcriptional regulator [Anaerolineales bacterium]